MILNLVLGFYKILLKNLIFFQEFQGSDRSRPSRGETRNAAGDGRGADHPAAVAQRPAANAFRKDRGCHRLEQSLVAVRDVAIASGRDPVCGSAEPCVDALIVAPARSVK